MKKVCCVCGTDLGNVPGPVDRLTHGFCEKCYRSELRAWEALLDVADERTNPPSSPMSETSSA